jgi:osmoprotectant transport system ATP-binding protein
VIRLREISKRYGAHVALHPLDLDLRSGHVTALIGPSGCGKSTLLRIILRLIEPTTGSVDIDGIAITNENEIDVRRKTGYVIQDGGLFPHLTARQNVTLLGTHLGEPVPVEELAKLTRLEESMLDRYPVELSGGQRQRIALMRALALKPATLLLDEPLGALDPIIRADLQRDLKSIFDELNATVVLVTHDMGEAAYLADSIVLMREGRIVQQGTLTEFQEQPVEPYVTEFLNAQRSVVAL